VLSTDEVLTKLALEDPIPAQAFELRFFAGLTNEEAAVAMGLSVASFRRYLKRANVFLRVVVGESRKRDSPSGPG
jgi:DNA-directed RNA polymerase specialized sigma24 family protein